MQRTLKMLTLGERAVVFFRIFNAQKIGELDLLIYCTDAMAFEFSNCVKKKEASVEFFFAV